MTDTQSELLTCALCGTPAPAGVTVMDSCPVCEDPSVDFRALPAGFRLKGGGHHSFEDGACLLEAVAYVAGEDHSDHPKCVSPVLASFGRGINDGLDADERQLLLPFIPRLIGTVSTDEHERRRVCAILDAVVLEIVPFALEAVGWQDLAERLRAIAPIVDVPTARAASAVLDLARLQAMGRRDVVRGRAGSRNASQALSYAYFAAAGPTAADAADAATAAIDVDAEGEIRRRILDAILRTFDRAIDTPASAAGPRDNVLTIDCAATPASIGAASDDDAARLLAEEMTP